MKILGFGHTYRDELNFNGFYIVALGRKQPPSGVSLLKVEPEVSTFPVIKSTVQILSLLLL